MRDREPLPGGRPRRTGEDANEPPLEDAATGDSGWGERPPPAADAALTAAAAAAAAAVACGGAGTTGAGGPGGGGGGCDIRDDAEEGVADAASASSRGETNNTAVSGEPSAG